MLLQTRPEYAEALADLARGYSLLNEPGEAAELLRLALAQPANTKEQEHQALEYQTNLAQMLTHLGQLEEAQKLHEANLEQREAVYGRNTAGYALGEAPFAELLLWRRDLEGAERHVKSAVAALFRAKQQQFVAASALWAAVRAARYADEQPLLTPFHVLSAPQQVELIRACLRRAQLDPPEISFCVLDELLERIEDAGGHEAPRQRVATTLARVAAKLGAHQKRIELLSWIRQQLDERGEARQALEATMALARAKEDAGDKVGSEATRIEAKLRAKELDEAESTTP